MCKGGIVSWLRQVSARSWCDWIAKKGHRLISVEYAGATQPKTDNYVPHAAAQERRINTAIPRGSHMRLFFYKNITPSGVILGALLCNRRCGWRGGWRWREWHDACGVCRLVVFLCDNRSACFLVMISNLYREKPDHNDTKDNKRGDQSNTPRVLFVFFSSHEYMVSRGNYVCNESCV